MCKNNDTILLNFIEVVKKRVKYILPYLYCTVNYVK